MNGNIYSKNDFAFWTGFYVDDEKPDYFEWASDKAYLDMNRTMTFKEVADKDKKNEKQIDDNRKSWRNEGTDIIRTNFRKLSGDFKIWHQETCEKLIKVYDGKLVKKDGNKRTEIETKLTYGQAQKWLNMTLKYLWLLYRLDMLKKEDSEIIENYERDFHVPLDSYILRYVAKSKKKGKDFPDNELSKLDLNEFDGEFKSEWSKINDDIKYYKYQDRLREAINKKQHATPLDWELVHWHKALKYYG